MQLEFKALNDLLEHHIDDENSIVLYAGTSKENLGAKYKITKFKDQINRNLNWIKIPLGREKPFTDLDALTDRLTA